MKTDIIAILDRSGSMKFLVDETISGYNHFIEEQRKIPGECRVSLVIFDTEYTRVYTRMPLADVPKLDRLVYFDRGGTALLDAIGITMTDHAQSIAADKWPDKVLMLITTDGQENASREYDKAKIKTMIEHAQKAAGWEFMYLSADPSAFADASSIGLGAKSTASYGHSLKGTRAVYAAVSASVGMGRSANVALSATLDGLKLAGGGLDEEKLSGPLGAQSQQAANGLRPKPAPAASLRQRTTGTPAP